MTHIQPCTSYPERNLLVRTVCLYISGVKKHRWALQVPICPSSRNTSISSSLRPSYYIAVLGKDTCKLPPLQQLRIPRREHRSPYCTGINPIYGLDRMKVWYFYFEEVEGAKSDTRICDIEDTVHSYLIL